MFDLSCFASYARVPFGGQRAHDKGVVVGKMGWIAPSQVYNTARNWCVADTNEVQLPALKDRDAIPQNRVGREY